VIVLQENFELELMITSHSYYMHVIQVTQNLYPGGTKNGCQPRKHGNGLLL
jgi:hypothetical protein